jgi:hypothetical protein
MTHVPPDAGYPANYDLSGRRKKSKAPKVALIVAGAVVVVCGGLTLLGLLAGGKNTGKASPAATTHASTAAASKLAPSVSASTAAPSTPATPVSADQRICRVTSNGGAYYLLVTSATEHNFQACAGAAPYAGTLDDLFKVPGMDRRCILPDQYTARNHAIVGVYSDTVTGNLTAARSFCFANGGTN